MNFDHDAVEGQQVKNLLTRYYYRSSQLYFQLVIELRNGDCVSYSEFNNYNVFKKALDSLQLATSSGAMIHIPKN